MMKRRIATMGLALCMLLALIPVTAFASREDAFKDAEDYTFGTTVSGKLTEKITAGTYAKAYKFSIDKSGAVQLSFTAKDTDHIVCGFFGGIDKSQVWSHKEDNRVLSGRGDNVKPVDETIHLTGGDYYFAVESYYDIEYTFTMTYTSVDESFPETGQEVNNTKETASEIELGNTYIGQIAKNDSEDYYKFTVPTDGPVTLNVTSEIYREENGQKRYIGPGSIYKDDSSLAISFQCDDQANGQNGVFRGTVELTAGNYYYRMGDTSTDKPCGKYTFCLSYNGSPAEYTITFDTQGGSAVAAQSVTDGGKVTKPADPTRTDYTFGGWYKEASCTNEWDFDSDTVTGDITLYAKWTPVKKNYTITLNPAGGTLPADQPDTVITNDDGKLDNVPKAPDRQDYTFINWFTATGKTVTTDLVFNGDTTIYAQWRKSDGSPDDQTYTISFDLNYTGAPTAPAAITTDTDHKLSADLPEVSREGYTFDGWYTEDMVKVSNDTLFYASITLKAQWTKNPDTPDTKKTFTITLDANDGTLSGASSVTTNENGKLDAVPAAPTREGYTFKGWFTAASGGEEVTLELIFTQDSTIYAQWEDNPEDPAKTYTITLNANGGALSGGSTVTTGEDGKLSAMPAAPTREGYTFDGWFTAASGGVKVDLESTFTQDSTIYAQWTKDTTPPSDGRYRVYGPGYVSGGRVDISHSTAEPGTRVTIELWPWSDYDLDLLTVTNLDTGRRLSLTERYSDEYTFIMPSSDVEVEVSYSYRYYNRYYTGTYYTQEETPVNTGPVKWYYSGGSIYHVDSGLVPTSSPLTRDMLISVLYNMDPSSSGDPTIWAGSKGIIPDIYISVLWGVDKPISREQTAMILYCYSQHMGYDTSKSTSLAGYTDYRQISAVARPAMSWARAAGLISGTSASTLSPQAILTSGQGGAILTRYVANVSRTW